jgi:hypothetical protein
MEKVSSMIASFELSFCPGCGMPCRDEHLLMCLACGSVYCGQGSCRVVCLCQDETSMHFPDRPAKEFFARLVRGNPFAVIIKDPAGRVIHATENESLLTRALGFSPREMVGKTNYDLFRPPASTTLNRIEFEVISSQRPFRFVTHLTTRQDVAHRFMVEVEPYRMTPGDHLIITTLTPASGLMATLVPGWNHEFTELRPCIQ